MDEFSDSKEMLNPEAFDGGDDDVIQVFQLESTSLRGRMVRLGKVLDDVLGAHDYPDPIAQLVAETMTLTVLLSSMLKYDGIFTLQTKGDGPVGMLVADMISGGDAAGDIRGCATYDEERFQTAREQLSALKAVESSQNHLAQYLGKGYIAFTVDQGEHMERYQGIVELQGSSLVDCVQHYFNQSEQIKTGIKMAVGQRDGGWRAGGLMIQMMPEEGGVNAPEPVGNLDEDDWRRTMVLMESASEDELLDADLHSNILLRRLYHEDGVRVFEPMSVQKNCRCSEDKAREVLSMLPEDDLEYMKEDDKIVMRCEFCSRAFEYDPDAFKK